MQWEKKTDDDDGPEDSQCISEEPKTASEKLAT